MQINVINLIFSRSKMIEFWQSSHSQMSRDAVLLTWYHCWLHYKTWVLYETQMPFSARFLPSLRSHMVFLLGLVRISLIVRLYLWIFLLNLHQIGWVFVWGPGLGDVNFTIKLPFNLLIISECRTNLSTLSLGASSAQNFEDLAIKKITKKYNKQMVKTWPEPSVWNSFETNREYKLTRKDPLLEKNN